jgi:hypothetical protein
MLSIERCKEILGDRTISDSQAESLRDALYGMVDSIMDNYFEEFDRIDICKKQ